ncbi:MAG: 5'/3'-nucleotidase SurE [Saprospiraceae bacterium]|nr:5'/3'-nucleotidase SurE [Saprospiraceae bacterium]
MSKPLILVTNDDGIVAPGIRVLVDIVRPFGDVVVVAPDSPQSGKGHAVTLEQPLRIKKVNVFPGLEAYECNGTPVDCVKLAKHVVLKDRKVDLCVSGINHGSNASINIIYSGTMSAAMEASLEGVNSIGFSLLNFSFDADFNPCRPYIEKIIRDVMEKGIPHSRLLNVNIPNPASGRIRGIRVCKQAEGRWREEFMEATDPRGEKYYWLTGVFQVDNLSEDTDIWALKHDFISVVPSGHDLTTYPSIPELKYLEV